MNIRASIPALLGCLLVLAGHAAEVRLGQSQEQGIRMLVWPGVAYGIPKPQPYGRQTDLAPFRQWRLRTRPNAHVVVASEAANDEGPCDGFSTAGVNAFDLPN